MGDSKLMVEYKKAVSQTKDEEEMIRVSLDFIYDNLRTSPTEIREIIEMLIPIVLDKKDKFSIARAYYARGWTKLDTDYYDEATEDFRQSYTIFKELEYNEGIIRTLNSLGASYTYMGDSKKAFEKYNEAMKVAVETGDVDSEARVYINMGEGFRHLKEYEDALEYYNKALSLNQEPSNRGIILFNMGSTHRLMGDNDRALHYINESLEIAKEESMKGLKLEIMTSLGAIYND